MTPYDSRGNDRDRYQARRHRPAQADNATDTRGDFSRSGRYGYPSRYNRYDGSGYGSSSRCGTSSQRQNDGRYGYSGQGRTGDRQQHGRYDSSRTPESNYQSRYQSRYRSSYQSSNDNGYGPSGYGQNGYRSNGYGSSGRYASAGSRNPYEPNGRQRQGRTDPRDAARSRSGRRSQDPRGHNRNASRRPPHSGKRPRRGLKPWILGVLIAVGIVVAAIAGYTAFINGRLQSNDAELLASLKQSDDNEPFYMLLMGVDSDEERQAEGDTGRSDSIMLVRVDPVNVKVTMVSIHRDTLVNISGYGNSKINA
ncbi:MAG: LCP family protein, partial [Atopobiaceae bacterium]